MLMDTHFLKANHPKCIHHFLCITSIFVYGTKIMLKLKTLEFNFSYFFLSPPPITDNQLSMTHPQTLLQYDILFLFH